MLCITNFSDFSTKRSLRKFLYRSFPSSAKAKTHFAAFSSTSSPHTKLLSSTTSSAAYMLPCSNVNCQTLRVCCILYVTGNTSTHDGEFFLLRILNPRYLMVNGFPFGDKAFFSRLAYYFSCRIIGPLYCLF